jgi:hypothetical protein
MYKSVVAVSNSNQWLNTLYRYNRIRLDRQDWARWQVFLEEFVLNFGFTTKGCFWRLKNLSKYLPWQFITFRGIKAYQLELNSRLGHAKQMHGTKCLE